MTTRHWHADILEGWRATTIPLGADSEGTLEATLVRAPGAPTSSVAVLYLHGFTDYFFQSSFGSVLQEHGYDFYALDLRKYGRSLRAGQTPNYTADLSEYTAELDEAAHIIRVEDGHDHLVVLGHSTGGLVASLWANARPRSVDAVVLNSPWFDLNEPWLTRTVGTRLVNVLARFAPRVVVGSLAEHYGRALHRDSGGDWDYDLTWKPNAGFPVRAGWMRTVRQSHARIRRGLDIRCPVLVCASAESGDNRRAHERVLTTDSVLNVAHMVDSAARLGRDVTLVQVPGGAHDLALSPEPARSTYTAAVLNWLNRHFLPEQR